MKKGLIILLVVLIFYTAYTFIDKDSKLSIVPFFDKIKAQIEVKYLTYKANKGSAKAQADLAQKYYDGKGIEKDYQIAYKWAKKGTEQNNAKAQNLLGFCYQYGDGVKKDSLEALKWFRLSAEQGFAKAQRNLGSCYQHGQGVNKDYKEAIRWYNLAIAQGDMFSQFLLGTCYLFGNKEISDVKKGYDLVLKSAQAKSENQFEVHFNLGLFYANGYFGYKSYAEALKWFRKSAQIDPIEFKTILYKDFFKDDQIIERLLCQAIAELGDSNAQDKLGDMLRENRNYSEAMKWYLKAAKQKCAYSQYSLGNMYFYGEGVMPDYQEAEKWLSLASEQGYAVAQKVLSDLYYDGTGVIQNYKEAYYWALIAVACGGKDYDIRGMIGNRDFNPKYDSLYDAKLKVIYRRDQYSKDLTAEQKQKVQKRAHKWLNAYNRRKSHKIL